MTDMQGKIVLVTGASSGIGEGAARQFAAAGARLILMARRADRLEKVASDLNINCLPLAIDVRNRTQVEATIHGLPRTWREIDILINSAGLSRGLERLHEGNPESWDEMVDTNVKGLLYVSRAVIPGMVQRGRGHIINIGSIAGHEVYPNGAVYCASKHAVAAITKGMMVDLLGTAIRVSTVDPGMVETEFSEVRFHGDKDRAKSVYKGVKPLTGDDIGEVILWVATRPEHVDIAEVVVMPTAQRSTRDVHRTA
jgi:3-hydroxy acid dehydrogenase / malonic semialdehyde reductase